MSEPFYLKCMGAPALLAPGGRPVKIRGHRHLALLIYIVVERRAQYRRDELATLLWPDADIYEARHSLSTGISAIRRVLGTGVVSGDRELVKFDHQVIRTDLDRLEANEIVATDEHPLLEVDVFLRDFEIRDAPDFSRWRDAQHARLLPRVHTALLHLIDHARRTGSSKLSGHAADRLRDIDPLSEEGARAKMEALAFAGDRIAALRVFEEWSTQLREELGASPGRLIEEMARRLRRRGLEREVGDPAPAVQTDPWRDRPFVGRAVEHRQLYEGWERAQQEDPSHFVLTGESGIGKSTLVERFALAAALEGALISRTQCYELERELPFAMISGLILGLADKPGVGSTDPRSLAEVARVVPRLRERFPGLPAPMDSHGETARLHFAEGILAMLEAAMEEHPVVLVVDDCHLSDEVSLTVLHLVIRRQQRGRLMVLLMMRTSELAPSSGAARILANVKLLRMTAVALSPLTEAEAGEMLASLIPVTRGTLTPAERRTLLHAGRGVPMVLQLLVQDWARHGGRSLAFEFRSMTEKAAGREGAGAEGMYRSLVERALAALDPVTRLVMHAASVLGSRMNDPELYQVADLTTSQTMMGMAALAQGHLLRDSPNGLEFVNELMRVHAYTAMPQALRQGVHLAVARRLLARLASGEEWVQGLEIAWHLVRGGRGTEATPHLLRGGREAIREGAPHEAELAFASALGEPGLLEGSTRNSAVLILAEIQQEQSRWHASLATLDMLRDKLEPGQAEQASLLSLIGRRNADHLSGRELPTIVEHLLDLSRTATSSTVKATAVRVAAGVLDQAQSDTLIQAIEAAIAHMRPLCAHEEERADLLTAEAMINYQRRKTVEGRAKLEEAITILEEAKVGSSTFVNLILGLSALACADGKYDEATVHGERGYRLATRLDHERLALRAASNLALAHGRLGNYKDQLAWAERKYTHLGPDPFDQERLKTGWMLGMAKAMLGDPTAISTYRTLTESIGTTSLPWVQQAAHLIEADLLSISGQHGRAMKAALRGTSEEHSELHSVSMAGLFARWIVKLGIKNGTLADAKKRLEKLMETYRSFDLLDHAEILLAQNELERASGVTRGKLLEELRSARDKLPTAVADQWARLGWTQS